MSVRLRLRRVGTRNKPTYRIVATDQRSPRDGRFIEILGFYDPRRPNEQVDLERADYWIGNGAQPSQTVASIIKRAKEGKSLTPGPGIEKPVVDTTKKPAPPAEKKADAPAEKKADAPVAEAAAPVEAEAAAPAEAAAEEAPAADATTE